MAGQESHLLKSVSWLPKQLHNATDVFPPVGLAPGSQYQLIFVTFGTTSATSSDINDYNVFVSAEAAANTGGAFFGPGLPLGLTWHAVVSSATVDARDNAPSSGLPVYNTHGQLLATSTIYAGSLVNPVEYNQFGVGYDIRTGDPWTGSDPFGVGLPGLTLGDPSDNAAVGSASSAGFWLDEGSGGGLPHKKWALVRGWW